ncbi:MAG: hypothetical protein VCE43_16935, partial [Myxococcota bacterium]
GVRLRNLGLSLAAVIVLLVVIEGLAGGVLFVRRLFDETDSQPSFAERTHTRYDAELGWVNLANHAVEGLYGPGAGLHTNAQGFRGDRDTAPKPAPGVFRVVCSGDSFTLGFGVGDEQTWCHRLRLPGRDVETVNMGQGGYGIDQAWLWYERDGADLGHQLHIFAFVYPDITRMTQLSFLRYGKPRVRYDSTGLYVENVPVPRAGILSEWLRRHRDTFGSLQLFRLLGPLLGRPLPGPAAGRFPPYSEEEAAAVAIEIFADVDRSNAKRSGVAVFVYLTSWLDLRDKPEQTQRFRDNFASALARRSLRFIDLTDDFRALSPAVLETLFIKPGETPFRHARGHYTAEGNAFVARALSRRLDGVLASNPEP